MLLPKKEFLDHSSRTDESFRPAQVAEKNSTNIRSQFRSGVVGGLLPLRQEHFGCTMGADLMGLQPASQVADSMVRKLIGKWRMTWALLNT